MHPNDIAALITTVMILARQNREHADQITRLWSALTIMKDFGGDVTNIVSELREKIDALEEKLNAND